MLIVAGRVGTRRHITVAANGDAFIVMRDGRGGVLAMRDTTGDGTADVMARFGAGEGLRNTVALAFRSQDGSLYRAVHGRDQLGQNWSNIYTQRSTVRGTGHPSRRMASMLSLSHLRAWTPRGPSRHSPTDSVVTTA